MSDLLVMLGIVVSSGWFLWPVIIGGIVWLVADERRHRRERRQRRR